MHHMTQVSENSAQENEVTETNVNSEEDYKLIEDALLQNPRGRWFLEEYIQRNRPEDTQKLLSAIQRIENTLSEKQEAPAAQQEIDPIRMSIIEMSKAIAKTREEIASIKPEDEQNNQLLTATEELSAIVESTETATNTILEAAEEIQEAAWSLREEGASDTPCDKIDEKTTDIYTACSFQDITGQRTTKVVQALVYIENRVNAMIDIWDLQEETGSKGPIKENMDTRPDSHLLNGPALKGDGLGQGCVDDMLTGSPETSEETSDQTMVDEMSFDAIGSQTEAVPNSEEITSEDVDAMSFDEIETQEISEVQTDETQFEMDAADASFENISIESGDSEALEIGAGITAFEQTELKEEPAVAEANFEQTEALVEDSGLEVSTDEKPFLSEDEVALSTEILPDSLPAQDDSGLETNVAEIKLEAPTESAFDEAPIAEINPLLEETQDLDDLDIAEFDQDLSFSTEEIMDLENPVTAEVPAMNPLAEMDPQSGMDPLAEIDPMSETVSSPEDTLDLSEMDFGDIEITDLSESPEPSPEAEEMQAADIEVKEEAPITSQAELGNVEEADIENLSEMQEQILLNE